MTFEKATREAGLVARNAVRDAMRKYKAGRVKHEDDLTGVLVGALDRALTGRIGGLEWDSSILTHRKGGEEAEYGADLLIHVRMNTTTQKYSKGVLVQAKRVERDEQMSARDHATLANQCRRMLSITPAAFVFNYSLRGMRCGAATRIAGASRRDLYAVCGWTSYRFFLELFRCPIGDPRITSAAVEELPVPIGLVVTATGELSMETGPRTRG